MQSGDGIHTLPLKWISARLRLVQTSSTMKEVDAELDSERARRVPSSASQADHIVCAGELAPGDRQSTFGLKRGIKKQERLERSLGQRLRPVEAFEN